MHGIRAVVGDHTASTTIIHPTSLLQRTTRARAVWDGAIQRLPMIAAAIFIGTTGDLIPSQPPSRASRGAGPVHVFLHIVASPDGHKDRNEMWRDRHICG